MEALRPRVLPSPHDHLEVADMRFVDCEVSPHLRQQNVVDENQANAIKDLPVLGDHDELCRGGVR